MLETYLEWNFEQSWYKTCLTVIGVKQPWYCIVIHDVDFKFTHPNASSYTLNVHTGKYDKFIYKAFDT